MRFGRMYDCLEGVSLPVHVELNNYCPCVIVDWYDIGLSDVIRLSGCPDMLIREGAITWFGHRGASRRNNDYLVGDRVQVWDHTYYCWFTCYVANVFTKDGVVYCKLTQFQAANMLGFHEWIMPEKMTVPAFQLRVYDIVPLHNKCQSAVVTWLLIGERFRRRNRSPINRDVIVLIGKMVWATRDYRCWEPQKTVQGWWDTLECWVGLK